MNVGKEIATGIINKIIKTLEELTTNLNTQIASKKYYGLTQTQQQHLQIKHYL